MSQTAAPATEAETVTRLSAVVRGQVQGVGYRYWAHHEASRLSGVTGVIHNRPDGSVEVEAESADRALLEALFVQLHVGPAAAQVVAVEPTWEEGVAPRFAGTGLRVQ